MQDVRESVERIHTAPRECRRKARKGEAGSWVWKKQYASLEEVLSNPQHKGLGAYICGFCRSWHTGVRG